MPNPSEISMGVEDNSQKTSFVRDLFFTGKEIAGDNCSGLSLSSFLLSLLIGI
ncbi:MAG: hypothetical protein PHO37_02390 [Kiritimatiellae bacterium]|nr:hypothetical protein [Kiritimatiellia bacterium]